jgi:flagellar FliJ protein
MQNILNIKEKLESQARAAFSLANRKYQEEQERLQEYVVRRMGYERRLKEVMQGDIDLAEVAHARSDLNNMKTFVHRQTMEVHKAQMAMEEARKKLNEVMQERKIQEKLREKAFDEFKHELAASETKEIDELVSFTHTKVEE